MADNAQDFTKILLVDVQVKSEKVKQELPILTNAIDELTQAQKNLKKQTEDLNKANDELEKQGKKNSATYKENQEQIRQNTKAQLENAQQLRQLKAEVREANKFIDNTAKAIDAETNSIAQNRALLSLLTAEHIKLGQANGDSKEKIDKSATAIRNLSNTLKDQEKQIGQTYRNVGNYEEAIQSVVDKLGGAVPGFQQFTAAITVANKVAGFLPGAITSMGNSIAKTSQQVSSFVGFKQFTVEAEEAAVASEELATGTTAAAAGETAAGAAAEGAAGGISAMGLAVGAVVGIVAGLAAGIYGLIQYLKTLDSLGDGTQQVWAGIKASFYAAAESIRAGDWAGLAHNMSEADKNARSLTSAMQDLGDAMVAQEVHNAQVEEQINTLMLKLRNKRNTPAQEQEYYNQIQALATNNYKQRKKNADDLYNLTLSEVVNGTKLTKQEIDALRKGGVDKAIEYENQNKIAVGSYKKIADAQKAQIAAEQFNDSVRERSQNRIDALLDRAKSKEEAAAAKAEKERQKEEQQRQKEAAALTDAENIRKASANRELQALYEEYGNQLVAADQSYNNELAKLQKFRDKKLITQKEYNSVEQQLTAEHQAKVSELIDKYNKQDLAKFQAAQNALVNLHIAGIDNDTARQLAQLKEQGAEKAQEIDRQNADLLEDIDKLDIEIKSLDGAAKKEAQDRRLTDISLLQINEQRRLEIIRQTAEAISSVNKKALDDQNRAKDSNDVREAGSKYGVNSSQEFAAKQKQLLDSYNAEVSAAGLTADAKLEIERKYIADKQALDDQNSTAGIEKAVQYEQIAQTAAFNILSNNLQARSQAILKQLDDSKNAELSNTNLTGGQKKAIEAKYQKLEDQEKLRAFKANQKLQAANALINGGVAVTKTFAEMGFLPALPLVGILVAQTAATIAQILAAKPGFETGGVFKSDGRGALLPGYSKKDNTNATLRSGEAVVVSEAMRVPWARNAVSRINQMFGGRSFDAPGAGRAFEVGGIFTDGGNANRYYNQPITDQVGLANSVAYQLINNFPPIYVDVKDVNAQQSILAKTVNRVSL